MVIYTSITQAFLFFYIAQKYALKYCTFLLHLFIAHSEGEGVWGCDLSGFGKKRSWFGLK